MKSPKKILILCDAHDFIIHEGNHSQLLKQLYVVVFLLSKHFNLTKDLLQINNRALFGFEVFWTPDSPFYSYFDPFMIRQSWDDIRMTEYDLIICHPEYQREVKNHCSVSSAIGSYPHVCALIETGYSVETLFDTAGSLFIAGGALEFKRSEKNEEDLYNFKSSLDQSANRFSTDRQESYIRNLSSIVSNRNSCLQNSTIQQVLILDDYKRAFFIGDSVYWLAKIKKLISLLPKNCQITLNIGNRGAFKTISDGFQNSLPDNTLVVNDSWADIDIGLYDLVLCNNDIFLKFHWFFNLSQESSTDDILLYSFTVMDERKISQKPTTDFYTNIFFSPSSYILEKANEKEKQNIFNEISLSGTDIQWADNWLRHQGLSGSDQMVVIIHGASSLDKIIYDAELLKFIDALSDISREVKILIISEKMDSGNTWLSTRLRSPDYKFVTIADSLSLREVMCLLGNKQVQAIIGPCTGLMHIADGVYQYLNHRGFINEPPLLLTYAGKQGPERNYHPLNWWKHATYVHCCVHLQGADGIQDHLVSLSDCPSEPQAFAEQSIEASKIKSKGLVRFILNRFPHFFEKLNLSDTAGGGVAVGMGVSTKRGYPVSSKIPTYIMNLKHRHERRNHIKKQFCNQSVFDWTIVDAIENQNPRLGLWQTIKQIVSVGAESGCEYLLIVEDDHQFTKSYSDQILFDCLSDSQMLGADILLGGVCYCDKKIKQVQSHLVSVNTFAGNQFLIIFRQMFGRILNAEFQNDDAADFKLSALSDRKLVIYPFISTQKDFGYSDVTEGYFEDRMNYTFGVASKSIANIVQ